MLIADFTGESNKFCVCTLSCVILKDGSHGKPLGFTMIVKGSDQGKSLTNDKTLSFRGFALVKRLISFQ